MRPLAYLAMGFGALTIFREEIIVHAIEVPLLLVGSAINVLAGVLANFAFRVGVIREESRNGDAGG